MDDTDRAQAADENNLGDALAAQRYKAALTRRPAARGECLNPRCGELFTDSTDRLFCNPTCERTHNSLKR